MTLHRFLNLVLPPGLALACGATALAAGPATGDPRRRRAPPGSKPRRTASRPTRRKANFNTGDFTMPNKVRFFRPGTDAIGDRAQGNSKRGTVSLFGNVVVHDSGNASEAGDAAYKGSGPATLTCDQLDVDSKARMYTATGHFHSARHAHGQRGPRAARPQRRHAAPRRQRPPVSDNGSTISANIVDYNLNTKDVQTHGSPTIMTQPATQQPAAAPRQPPPAKHTPAPRRTPPRAPAPKPSASPSPKPSGAP